MAAGLTARTTLRIDLRIDPGASVAMEEFLWLEPMAGAGVFHAPGHGTSISRDCSESGMDIRLPKEATQPARLCAGWLDTGL